MAEVIFTCSATQIFGIEKLVANYKRIAATELLKVEKMWLAAAHAQATAAGGLGGENALYSDSLFSSSTPPTAGISRHLSIMGNASFSHPNPSFVAHIAEAAPPAAAAIRSPTNTTGSVTPPNRPARILSKPTKEHLLQIKRRAAELPALIAARVEYNRRILDRFDERPDFDAVLAEVLEWAYDPRAPLLIHALGEDAVPTSEEWRELTHESDDDEEEAKKPKHGPLRRIKKKKDVNQIRIDFYNRKLLAAGVVSSVIGAREVSALLQLIETVHGESWEPVAESFSSSDEDKEDNADDSPMRRIGEGEESVLIPGFMLTPSNKPPVPSPATKNKRGKRASQPVEEDVVSKLLELSVPDPGRFQAAAASILRTVIAASPSALFENSINGDSRRSESISPFGSMAAGLSGRETPSGGRGGPIAPVAAQAESSATNRLVPLCENSLRYDAAASDGCVVLSKEELEAARGCVAMRTLNISSKGVLYICDEVGDLVIQAISLTEDVSFVKVLLGLLTDAVDLKEVSQIKAQQLKRGKTAGMQEDTETLAPVKRVGRRRLVADAPANAFAFGANSQSAGRLSTEKRAREVNRQVKLRGRSSDSSRLSIDGRELVPPLLLLEESEKRAPQGKTQTLRPPVARTQDDGNAYSSLSIAPLDSVTQPDRVVEFRSALVTETRGVSLMLRPPSTGREDPEPIRLFFPSHSKAKEFARVVKQFVREDTVAELQSRVAARRVRRAAESKSLPTSFVAGDHSSFPGGEDAPTAPPSKRPSAADVMFGAPIDGCEVSLREERGDGPIAAERTDSGVVDGLVSTLIETSVEGIRARSGRMPVSPDESSESSEEFKVDVDDSATDIESRRRRAAGAKLRQEKAVIRAALVNQRREHKIKDLNKSRVDAEERGDTVTATEASREIARLEAEGRGEMIAIDDDESRARRRQIPLTEAERRKAKQRKAERERDVEEAKKTVGWVAEVGPSSTEEEAPTTEGDADGTLHVANEIAEMEFSLMLKAAQRDEDKKRRAMESLGNMIYPFFSLDDHYSRIDFREQERNRQLQLLADEKAKYTEELAKRLRAQQDDRYAKEQRRRLEALKQELIDLRGQDGRSPVSSTRGADERGSPKATPIPLSGALRDQKKSSSRVSSPASQRASESPRIGASSLESPNQRPSSRRQLAPVATSPRSPLSPVKKGRAGEGGKVYSSGEGVVGIPVPTKTPEQINAINNERKQVHYDVYYEKVRIAEEKRTEQDRKRDAKRREAAQNDTLAELTSTARQNNNNNNNVAPSRSAAPLNDTPRNASRSTPTSPPTKGVPPTKTASPPPPAARGKQTPSRQASPPVADRDRSAASPRDRQRIEQLCNEVSAKEAAYQRAVRQTGVAPPVSNGSPQPISKMFDLIFESAPKPPAPVFKTMRVGGGHDNDGGGESDRIPTNSPLQERVQPHDSKKRDSPTKWDDGDSPVVLESLPYPHYGTKYSYYDHREFAYTVLRNEEEEAHYVLETKPRYDAFMGDLARRSDAERQRILQAAGKARKAASSFVAQTGGTPTGSKSANLISGDAVKEAPPAPPPQTSGIVEEMLPFSKGIQRRVDELARGAATLASVNQHTEEGFNYLPPHIQEHLDSTRSQLKAINENEITISNVRRKLLHGEYPSALGMCGFCLRVRGAGSSKDLPGAVGPSLSSRCSCMSRQGTFTGTLSHYVSLPVGPNVTPPHVGRQNNCGGGRNQVAVATEKSTLQWVPNANPFVAAGAPFPSRGIGGMGGPMKPDDEEMMRHFEVDPHARLPANQEEMDVRREMLLSRNSELMLKLEERRLDREYAVETGRLPHEATFRADRDAAINARDAANQRKDRTRDAVGLEGFQAFAESSSSTDDRGVASQHASNVKGELQVIYDGNTGRSQMRRVVRSGWREETSLSPLRPGRPPWLDEKNLAAAPPRVMDANGDVVWFDGHQNIPSKAPIHSKLSVTPAAKTQSVKMPFTKAFVAEAAGKGTWLSNLKETPPNRPEWQDYHLTRSHPPTPKRTPDPDQPS